MDHAKRRTRVAFPALLLFVLGGCGYGNPGGPPDWRMCGGHGLWDDGADPNSYCQ